MVASHSGIVQCQKILRGLNMCQVIALKAAASSAAADQAVIVRYASELTKERDALLQRSATLENKWIAAECRNVILRQRIADLTVSTD